MENNELDDLKSRLRKFTQAASPAVVTAAFTAELRAATEELFSAHGPFGEQVLQHTMKKCHALTAARQRTVPAADTELDPEITRLVNYFGARDFLKLLTEIQQTTARARYEAAVNNLVASLRREVVQKLLASPLKTPADPKTFGAIKHAPTRRRWAELVNQYGPKVFRQTATAAQVTLAQEEVKRLRFELQMRARSAGAPLPFLLTLNEFYQEQQVPARTPAAGQTRT